MVVSKKNCEKLSKKNTPLGSVVGQQHLLQNPLHQFDWTQLNCDVLDVNGQDVRLSERARTDST